MGTIHTPETLIAIVHEEWRGRILERVVVIMVNTLLHEMLAIDRFALAVPVPEQDGEIPRQRIRLFMPEPEFKTRCETHGGILDKPGAVIGHELLESDPCRQLAKQRNQHRQHVRNTGEPRKIGTLR